jgi:hypothetical protein
MLEVLEGTWYNTHELVTQFSRPQLIENAWALLKARLRKREQDPSVGVRDLGSFHMKAKRGFGAKGQLR